MEFSFKVDKKIPNHLGRAGTLVTPHGVIKTPAFVVVGTKATVKALTPEMVKDLGAQVVLANTYHLYLEPGHELIDKAGSVGKFMNWNGPTMTDSGGFQVFSLGAAFDKSVGKIAKKDVVQERGYKETEEKDAVALAKIDEEGVTFKSVIDGSTHRFTPERSIEIQHGIGADMIFAFDECTSPTASYEYQKEAMDRTHRWAKRCVDYHKANNKKGQALLGIVQGGRYEDLRKESAKTIAKMDFDGFGIGGSFEKEDMYTAVSWVNELLPENKPRHLLGIGEPEDLFGGVLNGCDLFDCVAPTRMARHGTLHTKDGRINITNAKYADQLSPLEDDCICYTCKNFTAAYLSHLFRAKEMMAGTLASIHNVHFIVNLVEQIRQSILDDTFETFRDSFIKRYYKR
jgi:queuine tRNA-ribosyltransferase